MRALAHGWKRSRRRRGEVGFLRKGILMKRLLAFALITAIGMFVIGCGSGETPSPGKPSGKGFQSGTGGGTTTAAPAPAEKKP
jgi:hypothetical protein